MKSIAIKGLNHNLQLIDVDLSPIKDDEVLVKTLETGICSTDRELLDYQKILPPKDDDFLIIGHEAVGEVIEVGTRVSEFKKGDIVVPIVRQGCGECFFCKRGRSDMCNANNYKERGILRLHGFMSEYFTEKEMNLIKVPEAIKTQAVLLEPLTIGIKAFEESFKIQKSRLYFNSKISENEIFKNALVIGAGSIGLLASLVLVCNKVNLTCVDIEKEGGIKSNIIKMMGGQYINLKEYKRRKSIVLTELRERKNMKEIDLMIDASTNPLTCFQLVDFLKFNGIIVHLGFPQKGERYRINLGRFISSLVLKNQVIFGSVNSNKTHFEKGKYYLEQSQKKFNGVLDKIITHRLHFTEYKKAFSLKSKGRIKAVLNWE